MEVKVWLFAFDAMTPESATEIIFFCDTFSLQLNISQHSVFQAFTGSEHEHAGNIMKSQPPTSLISHCGHVAFFDYMRSTSGTSTWEKTPEYARPVIQISDHEST